MNLNETTIFDSTRNFVQFDREQIKPNKNKLENGWPQKILNLMAKLIFWQESSRHISTILDCRIRNLSRKSKKKFFLCILNADWSDLSQERIYISRGKYTRLKPKRNTSTHTFKTLVNRKNKNEN